MKGTKISQGELDTKETSRSAVSKPLATSSLLPGFLSFFFIVPLGFYSSKLRMVYTHDPNEVKFNLSHHLLKKKVHLLISRPVLLKSYTPLLLYSYVINEKVVMLWNL